MPFAAPNHSPMSMTNSEFARQLSEDLDAEDLYRVLEVFRGDLARLRQALRLAALDNDAAGLRRAAHGLAGAAGAVGAGALEEACRRAMLRPGLTAADCVEVWHDIDEHCEAVSVELHLYLRNLDGSAG